MTPNLRTPYLKAGEEGGWYPESAVPHPGCVGWGMEPRASCMLGIALYQLSLKEEKAENIWSPIQSVLITRSNYCFPLSLVLNYAWSAELTLLLSPSLGSKKYASVGTCLVMFLDTSWPGAQDRSTRRHVRCSAKHQLLGSDGGQDQRGERKPSLWAEEITALLVVLVPGPMK